MFNKKQKRLVRTNIISEGGKMKNVVVLQEGIKECGCACLLSIIRYYHGNVSIDRLLELTKTDKDGTNFYNLGVAGKELGLMSKGYKVDNIKKLEEINRPFISQVIINQMKHFVVVYKIKGDVITIMDPAKGMVKLKRCDFEKIFTGNILMFEPYRKLPVYQEDNYVLEMLKEVIINNKQLIINLLGLSLIVTIFTCLYSYYFQIMIDNIYNNDKFNMIIITTIFLVILSINLGIGYLRNNLLLYLNEKIDLSIISITIKKIIFLPYNYYKNKTTGEVISRINDLFYIKNVMVKLLMTIFLDMILVVGALGILFMISDKLTWLLVLIVIIYILIWLVYRPYINKMTDITQEDSALVNSLLVETISSYETIKGLNLENIFNKKNTQLYLKSIDDNINFMRLLNDQEMLKDLFEKIIVLIITGLGINYVMDESMTLGALITFNTLVYYFIGPVREMVDGYKDFYYVKNSIKRINSLVSYQYENMDALSGLKINGNMIINKLSFSYNGVEKIINNLSLEIKDKEKVMFLGPTGSGKSTLLKLLYRYYRVDRDKIYLNGYDINDFKLKDIRDNMVYISQNEVLYTDTVRNNIILDREVLEEEFLRVCEITEVNDIIKNKLKSYDYVLEENGANLSGGQRQRIILARSLLKKSKILLIDEGLNEIDINLERKILKRIFDVYKDKTIIIITHRKDNMDLYDRVININGEVYFKNE